MPKTIPAAPQSITRKDYTALVRSAGFDPEQLRALRFAADGIYAEVYEADGEGRRRIERGESVISTVFIPVEG
jgi:hypothetical protein